MQKKWENCYGNLLNNLEIPKNLAIFIFSVFTHIRDSPNISDRHDISAFKVSIFWVVSILLIISINLIVPVLIVCMDIQIIPNRI